MPLKGVTIEYRIQNIENGMAVLNDRAQEQNSVIAYLDNEEMHHMEHVDSIFNINYR